MVPRIPGIFTFIVTLCLLLVMAMLNPMFQLRYLLISNTSFEYATDCNCYHLFSHLGNRLELARSDAITFAYLLSDDHILSSHYPSA